MASFYFIQEGARVFVHIKSDKAINAWQGKILLSENVGLAKINSASGIADIWQQAPAQEGREIVFTGGKMNGFTGDGVLFEFSLQPGVHTIRFSPETSAYLNDGLGTRVVSEFPQVRFVAEITKEMSDNASVDRISPEPFTPTRYQQDGFFDGKPVAIFDTQDLQSGVSHYEIRENTDAGVIDWHVAQSPYVINEDVISIEVKAVDYSGNERVESLNIRGYSLVELSAIAGAVLVIAILYTISRWRNQGRK